MDIDLQENCNYLIYNKNDFSRLRDLQEIKVLKITEKSIKIQVIQQTSNPITTYDYPIGTTKWVSNSDFEAYYNIHEVLL